MKMDAVIGAVLLVVLLIVLAIPVIHDATTEKTYHDNGGVGTAEYGTGSITIIHSSSGYTANSQAVTVPSNIVLWNSNMLIQNNNLYIYENGSRTTTSLGSSWTLTLSSGGTLRIYTGSGSTYQDLYYGTVSLGSTYHIKPDGAYLYVTSLAGSRIDYSSQVVGLTVTSSELTRIYGDADNRQSYLINASGGIGSASLSSEWSDEDRAFTVSGLTGELNGSTVTPGYLFVPAQYYSEDDREGTAYDLLKVLPILIVIGIAFMITRAIRERRGI